MKKRFALYGMFAAMAIFATACGDDSSSGPEEESSSSIEAEDESSSSVEEEGKSSAKEEGKSSAADKKSSSSEAKKGDSSSSEKTTSSSSAAVSSSSGISYEPTCVVKTEGSVASVETHFYATDMGGDVEQFIVVDYDNFTVSSTQYFVTLGVTSCEEAKTKLGAQMKECSPDDETVSVVSTIPSEYFEPTYGTLANAEEVICGNILSEYTVDTTALNQEMLAAGKYGTFRDTRDAMLYRTIKIGNQTWMAQNLLYETESGSSCYDDPMPEGVINGNCLVYGRLYTWDAAKSACPTGWRLPTMDDFTKLVVNVDSDFGGTTGPFDHGDKLMTENWGGDSNEIGFSAVPAGYYVDAYKYAGSDAYFWVQIETTVPAVMFLTVKESGFGLGMLGGVQMSVRCIKDDAPSQSVSSN